MLEAAPESAYKRWLNGPKGQAWKEKNAEKRRRQNKEYRQQNAESINKQRAEYRVENSSEIKARSRNFYKENPELWILGNIRTRARKLGLPFDLTIDDIKAPEYCPVLGIKLERNHNGSKSGPKPNSPAVDRIIPELGYVRGNVLVVSHLANCIKQNAQPDQIRRVADFYERLWQEQAIKELRRFSDV